MLLIAVLDYVRCFYLHFAVYTTSVARASVIGLSVAETGLAEDFGGCLELRVFGQWALDSRGSADHQLHLLERLFGKVVGALNRLNNMLKQVTERLKIHLSELVIRLADVEVHIAEVQAYRLVRKRSDEVRQEVEGDSVGALAPVYAPLL